MAREGSRVATIAMVVAAIAAVFTALFTLTGSIPSWIALWAPEASSPSTSLANGDDHTPGSESSNSAGSPSDRLRDALCMDVSGNSTPCQEQGSLLIVLSQPCNSKMVIESFGLDENLLQLDISTTEVAGRCAVGPGSMAIASGATTEDIALLKLRGVVSPKLQVCAGVAGGAAVSCYETHTVEFVTPWVGDMTGSDDVEWCQRQAGLYSGKTYSELGSQASPIVYTRGGEKRCALESKSPTVGSLRASP